MCKRRTLKELTLKDNFMFGAVMSDERNCKRLLELILQFPIQRVEVSKEKSFLYHPEYKGVRLDVYAKDEKNTHYNVEMQAVRELSLGKRARYYHSQIDMELLLSGAEYAELPNTFVIFICDFDPFGLEKYCYTFESRCLEELNLNLPDGSRSIFLNTRGKNPEDVPETMVKFLNFVKADLQESTKDFGDEFVESLQRSVQQIKESRVMEEKFMVLHEMIKRERAEGKAEGKAEERAEAIIELLEELGEVSEELREQIRQEEDLAILKKWFKQAAKANSVEQFKQGM